MGLTPLIPNPDDLKRTLGDAPPQVGPGQLRQLQALTAAPPSGGMPSLGGLPPLSGGKDPNLKALDTGALPGLKPIVTSPRQQQEQELQQKISSFENPQKPQGFWQKLGHALSMNPYSMAYRNTQENQRTQELAGLQKQDVTEQDAASKRGLEGAQAAELAERTAEMPAESAADVDLKEAEAQKANRPDLAQAYATAVVSAMAKGQDPSQDPVVQHLADAITSIQKQPLAKGSEHVSVLDDKGQPIEANYDPTTRQFTRPDGTVIKNPRPVPAPATMGPIVVDPGGHITRATPGGTLPTGARTISQQGSQDIPTNQMRNMGEMAATVQPQMDAIKQEVQQLAGSLGPAVGRWNELMVNKGGTDFPEFAGLDTDLDLLASAIVRTHFGARGGGTYREELRKQFGEAQSPEDLMQRIDHAEGWIKGYAAAGGAKLPDSQGGGGTKGPAVGAIEGGYKFKGGDASKKENWEQVTK